MHKIKVFVPEVIYGARNGLLSGALSPGSTPHNDPYREAPRERGIVMGPVYKRVDILLAEVYERSGKRVISACKKAQKDKAHDHVVYLF